jgi:uncharacterized membrane protein
MSSEKPAQVPRLFGHPWHAALVHVPMALLALPFPLDVIAWATSAEHWWQWSRGCLGVGFASAVVAAVAGFVDLGAMGAHAAAERTANRHLAVMLVASVLAAINGWLRLDAMVPTGVMRWSTVALSASGLVALLWGGWLGGELVFRHRIGQADDTR